MGSVSLQNYAGVAQWSEQNLHKVEVVGFDSHHRHHREKFMKNLEPKITRQRLIIEAKYETKITEEDIKNFLLELGKILKMTVDIEPLVKKVDAEIQYGFYGYVHWIESGSHIYTWEKLNFLTIDIYTCKHFFVQDAIDFVKEFFKTKEIVYKEV